MNKFSVNDIGYSLEKYFNNENCIEDAELQKLWNEGKEILKKIENKLREFDKPPHELNLLKINHYIDESAKQGISLMMTVYDSNPKSINYVISKTDGKNIAMINWEEKIEELALFLYSHAYEDGVASALKNSYDCVEEVLEEHGEELEDCGYYYNIGSVSEVCNVLKSLNNKLK